MTINQNQIQLYTQSKAIAEQLSQIKVFNLNTMEIYKQQEETMEVYAQKVFGYKSDKEPFSKIEGVPKNVGLAHVSKAVGEVLSEVSPENIMLVFLSNFVDQTYEKIKYFKSVVKVCGNPDDEADLSINEEKRKQYIEALSTLVARQVFAYKLELNQIINPKIKDAVDRIIWNKDSTRAIFGGLWQTANTLKEGGVNPKYINKMVKEIVTAERDQLQEQARNGGWGYLQDKTEKKKLEKTMNE